MRVDWAHSEIFFVLLSKMCLGEQFRKVDVLDLNAAVGQLSCHLKAHQSKSVGLRGTWLQLAHIFLQANVIILLLGWTLWEWE